MRCAKCKEKGHAANACPTGDALDQLDKVEGWEEPKPGRFTRDQFGKVKEAHFKHGIEARLLRMNYPAQGLHEINKVIAAKNYDDYLADATTDFLN